PPAAPGPPGAPPRPRPAAPPSPRRPRGTPPRPRACIPRFPCAPLPTPNGGPASVAAVSAATLADRLVIINADELGLTRASNVGVYDALRHGAATSASLMVPAPWARDAAAGYRG